MVSVNFVGMCLLVVFLGTAMGIKLLGQYYPEIFQNLATVNFSRAIGSRQNLNTALNNHRVILIYVYVRMGYMKGEEKERKLLPIVSLRSTSDLTLEEFLRRLVEYNEDAPRPKAAIIHFAYENVFDMCEDALMKYYEPLRFLVMINACVLKGPGDLNLELHDPYAYLRRFSKFPDFILSVQWTAPYIFRDLAYTKRQIAEMVVLLQHHRPSKIPVAIRMRSPGILAIVHYLRYMIDHIPNSTIVVYENTVDEVVQEHEVTELIERLGRNEVMFQISRKGW